jgi:hypothetical protein
MNFQLWMCLILNEIMVTTKQKIASPPGVSKDVVQGFLKGRINIELLREFSRTRAPGARAGVDATL